MDGQNDKSTEARVKSADHQSLRAARRRSWEGRRTTSYNSKAKRGFGM